VVKLVWGSNRGMVVEVDTKNVSVWSLERSRLGFWCLCFGGTRRKGGESEARARVGKRRQAGGSGVFTSVAFSFLLDGSVSERTQCQWRMPLGYDRLGRWVDAVPGAAANGVSALHASLQTRRI
jgi:hypothetical protein